MIVLTDKMNSEINAMVQSYDDLENKPIINGVVLEGDLTTEEIGIKGIPYVVFTSSNTGFMRPILGGDLDKVIDAALNNQPFTAYYYAPENLINLPPFTLLITTSATINDGKTGFFLFHFETDLPDTNYTTHQDVKIKFFYNEETDKYETENNIDVNRYNYITQIPSYYTTDTELNEAIANVKIPHVVFTYNYPSFGIVSGNLTDVINAIKRNKPALIYFKNNAPTYGLVNTYYQISSITIENDVFNFSYHTELGTVHKDIVFNGFLNPSTEQYEFSTIGTSTHSYATPTYVDEQIGNINTILENIIG